MPPEILGPYGLAVALLIAVGVLWRAHDRSDAAERQETDEWRKLAQENSKDLGRLTRAVESLLNIKVPPST